MKISGTKPSTISVGRNHYSLEPAVSRTHYGENRQVSGGQPYAFATKRADDAWFVVSAGTGKKLGLVQQWDAGEWTFSKVGSQVQAPVWLRAQWKDVPSTIVNLSSRLFSGATPEEAIAQGLGVSSSSVVAHATRAKSSSKSTKQLDRDIADATGLRDGWTKVRVRKDWPETWEKHLRTWWYTLEKQANGRWAVGVSHRRGDSDHIDRGGTYATWEAAAKFAEEHAR